jgi:VDE lipocalin domain
LELCSTSFLLSSSEYIFGSPLVSFFFCGAAIEFWENWYIIGENDKDMPEFKFVYYNGKTRQNTYEGAFVYSRTKDLPPESMQKVYQIALDAGMDPQQFCRIRNGCFADETNVLRKDNFGLFGSPANPFRGILASTRVSELLGVEPVAARDVLRRNTPTAPVLTPELSLSTTSPSMPVADTRKWWHEVGDYLENPHRHFAAMDQLRQPMDWPKDIVESSI